MSRSLFVTEERLDPWYYERLLADQGLWPVAGADEVGRGCLAGPVVAAAVILPQDLSALGITDSKRLTPQKRLSLDKAIREVAISVAVAQVEPEEIDRTNILVASLKAMKMAIESLSVRPRAVLVDGNQPIEVSMPQRAVVGGDRLSCSIAAASIVAKVYRDRLMEDLARKYPHYNFDKHKGYATRDHRKRIMTYGPCPIHRKSFKGVMGS